MSTQRKTLLVLGATSDIGRAVARAYAGAGWAIQLAARDTAGLARDADELLSLLGMT